MSLFRDLPSYVRNTLANGGLPGEVLTEWVGAEEAKRLRVEVMRRDEAWVAEVCGVPRPTVVGWEDASLVPTHETTNAPPDFGLPQVLALYSLAAWAEAEVKASATEAVE